MIQAISKPTNPPLRSVEKRSSRPLTKDEASFAVKGRFRDRPEGLKRVPPSGGTPSHYGEIRRLRCCQEEGMSSQTWPKHMSGWSTPNVAKILS